MESSPRELPGTAAASPTVRRLLDFYLTGAIAPGDRLPPERQLATMFDVGRSAIREALAALEILGVVEVKAGSGSYLRGTSSELLPQTLSWGLLLEGHQTLQLCQLRTTLEVATAQAAARRITDSSARRLGEHVAAMKAHVEDYQLFVEADMRFHRELGAASDNEPMAGVLQALRALLRVGLDRAVRQLPQTLQTLKEHEMIYLGVVERDADAAGAAMRVHMDSVTRRILTTRHPNSVVQ